MKYILVIGDGMADHPLDTLGGRTPLEASKKDAIDALARHGILGSVRNVPEDFAPGSDTAIMSIFGCSPRKYFFGRAPLEAAASGIQLAPGDACYRCNMVTYADEDVPFEHKHILSHSAGSIEGRESDELVTMLFHHPDFRPLAEQAGMVIHKGSSFRHLAVQSHVDIKGIRLAPPHDHLGEEIGPILPTGCPNADVLRELMRRAFDILDQHPINVARRAAGKLPANGVWFWAEGTAAALPNFPEHYGSDGGVVSAVPLCHGIGILTGLEAVTVPTATGEWDTDYAAKVAAALNVLKKHDFVALHLEGPDEATHNHDLEHKIYSIERLSADVVAPVTEALRAAGEDFRLLLLADHMHQLADIDFHRARSAAKSIAGTCCISEISELALKCLQQLGILTGGTQACHLTINHDALTRGKRKAAAHAVDLAETAFNALVDEFVGKWKRLEVLYVTFRVVVEYHARIENVLRVEQGLYLLHDTENLCAPLFLDKRRHIAASAMLGFQRAIIFVDYQALNLFHQMTIAVNFGIGVERLRNDEVIVSFKGMAVDTGIGISMFVEHLLQVGSSFRKVLDMESHVFY